MDSPFSTTSRTYSQKILRSNESAFRRITSEKNFSQIILPSFMRTDMFDPFRHHPPTPNRKTIPKRLSHPILQKKNRNLTRKDLQSLRPQVPLTPNLVDACLSQIKQLNSQLLQEQKVNDRVLIASCEFSQYIFCKNSKAHSKSNILKYEQDLFSYLLLPVYQEYWTLIVVNFREKVVKIFDPCKKKTDYEEKLSSLFEFLQHQIRFHYRTEIQMTIWGDFVYLEREEQEVFEAEDSGVYILKQAENIARDRKESVMISEIEKYRFQYLQQLFNSSQRVVMG